MHNIDLGLVSSMQIDERTVLMNVFEVPVGHCHRRTVQVFALIDLSFCSWIYRLNPFEIEIFPACVFLSVKRRCSIHGWKNIKKSG